MNGEEVIRDCLTKRLPGAAVEIVNTTGRYSIVVASRKFTGLTKADAQGLLYSALGVLPLTLIARVEHLEAVPVI